MPETLSKLPAPPSSPRCQGGPPHSPHVPKPAALALRFQGPLLADPVPRPPRSSQTDSWCPGVSRAWGDTRAGPLVPVAAAQVRGQGQDGIWVPSKCQAVAWRLFASISPPTLWGTLPGSWAQGRAKAGALGTETAHKPVREEFPAGRRAADRQMGEQVERSGAAPRKKTAKTTSCAKLLSPAFIECGVCPTPSGWGPRPRHSAAPTSLLPVGGVEAQGGPQGEVGEEDAGHVLQLGVGAQGLEVLHVAPEVGGGERPVRQGRRLGVGVWRETTGLRGWAVPPPWGTPSLGTPGGGWGGRGVPRPCPSGLPWGVGQRRGREGSLAPSMETPRRRQGLREGCRDKSLSLGVRMRCTEGARGLRRECRSPRGQSCVPRGWRTGPGQKPQCLQLFPLHRSGQEARSPRPPPRPPPPPHPAGQSRNEGTAVQYLCHPAQAWPLRGKGTAVTPEGPPGRTPPPTGRTAEHRGQHRGTEKPLTCQRPQQEAEGQPRHQTGLCLPQARPLTAHGAQVHLQQEEPRQVRPPLPSGPALPPHPHPQRGQLLGKPPSKRQISVFS